MPTLIVETYIAAPVQLCFDMARDIPLHCRISHKSGEHAVAGITQGLIGLGESVTFEAKHFGVRQRLTARVTEMTSPYRFVDEMVVGAFQSLRHTHEFTPTAQGTLMRDTVTWISPFGVIGKMADWLLLVRHMRLFLLERSAGLKAAAERAVEGD